ncbi:MAG: glycosyl transferase family 4 [Candidatus Pacearchaeota archaeon]|nr:MAG: glycosyl transferase family 4 [Candidatus Pacearchaeota archaeon]
MISQVLITVLYLIFAFVVTLLLIKWWISIAKKNKLQGKDMNKYKKPLVAEAGGIAVVLAIVFTLFLYIFFKTFVLKTETHFVEVFALIVTLLLACFIGFIDDILGWKKGIRGWKRILMTIPIAIPLMVINAGHSTMSVPFLGSVDFGLVYPLVIVLVGIIGATNGFNLLAGYNGLEAGLGIVIFATLGAIAFFGGNVWLALIAGIIIFSLLGFLIFNQYPAKIFPGDSLTYSIGALIAVFAILGNMEKAAFLLFIPFIIEGILKARSKFKAENFGKPNKDGSLEVPYKKTYSLTHASILFLKKVKKKAYEKDVVRLLLIIELIIAVLIMASYV